MTSDDDKEISECINLVLHASKLGLVHESINVNRILDYTRKLISPLPNIPLFQNCSAKTSIGSWFAWANSVFAQTILDLAQRKPHLIFGAGAEPYIVE